MTANVTAGGPGWLVRAGARRDSPGPAWNSWGLAGAGRDGRPANRFFSGRPTSLAVTLKILEALHLGFEEVATPVVEDQAG
ncbi:MAG: hypothetical protein E6J41_03790 [Chloroflexi bacterium]|nr:MAG: hypothetical protein E6J41_03790 [Chloroflexota bacterium]